MTKAETLNKPKPKAAKVDSIADCEGALRSVDAKQLELAKLIAALNEQREKIGYAALIDDDLEAVAELKALNDQQTALEGEQQALKGALAEASRRLGAAQRAAERGDRRLKAKRVKKLMAEATDLAAEIDPTFEQVFGKLLAFESRMNEIASSGCRPTRNLIHNGVQRALRTVITARNYLPDVSPLPQTERRSFTNLAESWRVGVEHWANQQLGADDDGDSSEGKK